MADRRVVSVRIAGEERWIAGEDSGRYRDAVGAVPADRCSARSSWCERGRAAFAAASLGPQSWAVPDRMIQPSAGSCRAMSSRRSLEQLMAEGTILRGEFRPGGVEREWCDPEVLRLLRRRSLARLRREIEPVEPTTLARFLPAWHGVGRSPGRYRATRRGHRPARGPGAPGQHPGA